MFNFILGFIIGGVAGAAIVLALSRSHQPRPEETEGLSESSYPGPEGSSMADRIRTRLEEAIEEGRRAAEGKAAEMREQLQKQRGEASPTSP